LESSVGAAVTAITCSVGTLDAAVSDDLERRELRTGSFFSNTNSDEKIAFEKMQNCQYAEKKHFQNTYLKVFMDAKAIEFSLLLGKEPFS
jgi:hypothetical protein